MPQAIYTRLDTTSGCLVTGFNQGVFSIMYTHSDDPSQAGQRFNWDASALRLGFNTCTLDRGSATLTSSTLWLPFWLIVLLLGGYPLIVLVRGALRRWHRGEPGGCPRCGYDLTGNVTGTCSECGVTLDPESISSVTPAVRAADSPSSQRRRARPVRKCILIGTSALTIVSLLFGLLSYRRSNTWNAVVDDLAGNWIGTAWFGFATGEASLRYCHGRDTGDDECAERTRDWHGLKLSETTPTIPGGLHGWDLRVPFWITLIIFGLYPTLVLLRWLVRRRRAQGEKAPSN